MPKTFTRIQALIIAASFAVTGFVAFPLLFSVQPDSSDAAMAGAQGFTASVMSYLDEHQELTGMFFVVVDGGGNVADVSLSRGGMISHRDMYVHAIRQALYKATHPKASQTVVDHMPRLNDTGHRGEHAL